MPYKDKTKQNEANLNHYYRNRETILAQRAEKRKLGLITPEERKKDRERASKWRKSSQFDTDRFVSLTFSTLKRSAADRNIKVSITKEQLHKVLIQSNGKCAISGLALDTMFNSCVKASIDRIDSNKGYTLKNIQVVASCVNIAKSDLPQDDFIKLCKSVVDTNY
jgi:cobyrinic acid a,c-diamide synthase